MKAAGGRKRYHADAGDGAGGGPAAGRTTEMENEKRFEEQTVPASDGYALSTHTFDCADPKAVVLFIHGMEEYQDRYIPFACFLQEHGYAVVTADLRGHGRTAPKLSHIADRDGDKLLIEDEKVLLNRIRDRWQGTPVFLFAHSMGTIIARKLMQTDSGSLAKAVLSGYPNPQAAARIGAKLAGWIAARKGKDGHSGLIDNMVLGSFSKSVKDAKTPCDWLSVNPDNVKAYMEDPLCGKAFTLGSYDALFRLLADIGRPELYRDVKADLPILLIAGAEDPCVGGEKGKADSLDRLQRAGFRNIRTEDLPGMRHEILNEKDNILVYRKILAFFDE